MSKFQPFDKRGAGRPGSRSRTADTVRLNQEKLPLCSGIDLGRSSVEGERFQLHTLRRFQFFQQAQLAFAEWAEREFGNTGL